MHLLPCQLLHTLQYTELLLCCKCPCCEPKGDKQVNVFAISRVADAICAEVQMQAGSAFKEPCNVVRTLVETDKVRLGKRIPFLCYCNYIFIKEEMEVWRQTLTGLCLPLSMSCQGAYTAASSFSTAF